MAVHFIQSKLKTSLRSVKCLGSKELHGRFHASPQQNLPKEVLHPEAFS